MGIVWIVFRAGGDCLGYFSVWDIFLSPIIPLIFLTLSLGDDQIQTEMLSQMAINNPKQPTILI